MQIGRFILLRVKRGTYKEIGKHFLTLAAITISVGLLTPLLTGKGISSPVFIGVGLWVVLFILGAYFINRGEEDG